MSLHHRACHLCEAICGLSIVVEEGDVVAIRGDREDPLSRGHICPKGAALGELHRDPDRLRQPLRRRGDRWEPIGWRDAFELAAESFAAIQRRHGDNALAVYAGNPNVHNYGLLTHGPALIKSLKTRNRFSATSVDQLPHQLTAYWMFGHQFLVPVPDIDRADFFLMLGANPLASNGSLMTAPDVRRRLRALQKRGGRLVALDPRRTETARIADEHYFIRPGSDAALLAAILQVIFTEGLANPGRLAGFLDGFGAVPELVAGFSPESVADFTGVAPETVRSLARRFAAAKAAVCYGRMGLSTQPFGATCQWLIQVINIATGNLDRPGGVMFTTPAFDLVGGPGSRPGHHGVWRSRVRSLPETGGELPVAALAEEIDTPGEGRIRGLATIAGNPALSTPNGARLERALGQLDFMVSVDPYLNETTRHAHLILPPASALAHDHYDIVFHVFAVRNTARYNPPLFKKPADARYDWEILAGLTKAIHRRRGSEHEPLPPPRAILDAMLRDGPHGLSLARLQDHPHGLDLGPLKSCLPRRLHTETGRIQCAPEPLVRDLDRLAVAVAHPSGALSLIGRRHLRANNSWMHNLPSLVRGKDRCRLMMSPVDAERLGLADGSRVRVRGPGGAVETALAVTDEIMPGVVSLSHGYGHHRPGVRLRVAARHAGVSVNDLTDENRLDPVSGNAAFSGTPVTVEALPVAAG